MSDESQQDVQEQDDHHLKADETPSPEELAAQEAAAAGQIDNDGFVEAKWSVAVIPKQNVSIHYRVSPTGDGKAVTSVTASFVEMKDGMIEDTFAGATTTALIEPKEGQGLTGDMGADFSVFANRGFGQVAAIVAGLVNTDDGPRNFFFWRPIDPAK